MYTRWLATRRADDLSRFRRARSACCQAVRGAKNQWYEAKAKEAQKGRFGGKLVWRCIRDMQHSQRGLVPSRSVTLLDEEGSPCTTPECQQQRWRRHFTTVLNRQSVYSWEELNQVKQRPLRSNLAERENSTKH